MSRSGYSEDCDNDWSLIMYRGSVRSAMRGKRGQAFFRDLVAALDALPEKKLIAHSLTRDGAVCAIGALGLRRGVDMETLDPEDAETVAAKFDIAEALAREIVYENDEAVTYVHKPLTVAEIKAGKRYGGVRDEKPEERWARMRAWAARQIKPVAAIPAAQSEGV